MSEIKHSPTPWAVATNPGGPMDQPAFPPIVDASGNPHGEDIVAMPLGNSETVQANAAHIVKCVNLHEELVDALQELLSAARHCGLQHGIDFDHFWETAATQAKNAIAKATK